MTLYLCREQMLEDGIFSQLRDASGKVLANTLEHSYTNLPKIPDGTFTCVRGNHLLHGMTTPFSTFEVTGVDGHTGLLFHWGNFNEDSDGCILLGEGTAQSPKGQMITNSRAIFAEFMQLMDGIDNFELVVS